jgi:hypothetical protein
MEDKMARSIGFREQRTKGEIEMAKLTFRA